MFSRIDIKTYSLLTDIYNSQSRYLNLEPSIEKILITYESRKPENLQTTLILLHDVTAGWVTSRTPHLIKDYEKAIDDLKNY